MTSAGVGIEDQRRPSALRSRWAPDLKWKSPVTPMRVDRHGAVLVDGEWTGCKGVVTHYS